MKSHLRNKENYCNYLSSLNDYYDSLFKIPEKLKKYEKHKRNDKLRAYLTKISECKKEQSEYLYGFAFPVEDNSVVVQFNLSSECEIASRILFHLLDQGTSAVQDGFRDDKLRGCCKV